MFIWIAQSIMMALLSPLFVGVIRKIKAKLQNRNGAGVFQPYRDAWKLFRKDEVISRDASWIFSFSPYILFTTTLVAAGSIPFVSFMPAGHSPAGDFLVVIYLLALGTFFLALAGMDAGSAFGGFGSSREMTVAALAEGGLIASILTLALSAHTTNLFKIAEAVASFPLSAYAPVALAFAGFFIVLLAETGRYPFDNPATHLELTMIHEAMLLEYSGKRLALMEWASANKLLIFLTLGANLFFPWGLSHSWSILSVMQAFVIFTVKILLLCAAIAVIESSTAKIRFFRIPDLLFTSFILSATAIWISSLSKIVPSGAFQFPFFLEIVVFVSIISMHAARKNSSIVFLYVLQSSAITLLLFIPSYKASSTSLMFVTLLTFVVKVVMTSYFFSQLIKSHRLTFSVSTYLSMPVTLIVISLLTVITFSRVFEPLTSLSPESKNTLALSLASIFISLFLIINRKGALSQMIGILSLENGIVCFATFAGLEQTPGLQLGVIFDIFVWVITATVFISMIYRHFGSLDVSAMRTLKE